MYDLNVILSLFVLHLLIGLMYFIIDEILVLIIVAKSSLSLLIFSVKEMCVLISWLIYNLFIDNHFIGIIGFLQVYFYNSL